MSGGAAPADALAVAGGPLRLLPIAVPRPWGGDRLLREPWPRLDAAPPIGETWAVSDVGDDPAFHSRIADGPARGRTLRELIRAAPAALLGRACLRRLHGPPVLPLLVKFLDAAQNLSVQLHPSDDDLRRRGEAGFGKNEAWVVLDAEPGAWIGCGFRDGVTLATYLDELARGADGAAALRRVEVERGDFVYLPAGTVHAIGAGVLVAEVQQSSDVTYRIWDWGRVGLDGKPRALHLDEARGVAPPRETPPCPLPVPAARGVEPLVRRVACPQFTLDEIVLAAGSGVDLRASGDRFAICSVLAGAAELRASDGAALRLGPGDVLFLPAACDETTLEADTALWGLWVEPVD